MKISKSRPLHWIYLAAFSLQALLGLCGRLFTTKEGRRPVILYGHKLNGNLLGLHARLESTTDARFHPVFLTMDLAYHRELTAAGIESCWAGSPACAGLLARAAALVSDHGLHSLQLLQPLYRRLDLHFFDVWHGIPFKGFDAGNFRLQHRYDEVWVASELNRKLYVERFGFRPEQVVVTGYARTDKLLRPTLTNAESRRALGLPATGKLVLFAPTWSQDNEGRSIFPFGHGEGEFLQALSTLGQRLQTTFILRTHLNSADSGRTDHPGILRLPSTTYPDTEGILLACDMMICDWSSIAFDFLLLERPTFFLDVPPPFRKGFSLGPEYRFGEKIRDLPSLLAALERCILEPEQYWQVNGESHRRIRQQVYGEMADGRAAERYVARLSRHVFNCESSQ